MSSWVEHALDVLRDKDLNVRDLPDILALAALTDWRARSPAAFDAALQGATAEQRVGLTAASDANATGLARVAVLLDMVLDDSDDDW